MIRVFVRVPAPCVRVCVCCGYLSFTFPHFLKSLSQTEHFHQSFELSFFYVCEIRILSKWNSQFYCSALWCKGAPYLTSVLTNRVVSWRNLITSCVWNIIWNGMQSKSIFRKAIGGLESYLWANGCYYCDSVFSQWHKCQSRDAADGKEMPQVKVS